VLAPHMGMAQSNPSAVSNLLKLQSQMTKELIEAGVWTVITHSCTDCAPLSMCLVCSLSHKHRNPSHQLRQSIPKSLLLIL
jgi:hypothetical protein